MTSEEKDIIKHFLDYELRSSWWADLISIPWMQELSARYFVWKTTRKVERFLASKAMQRVLRDKLNKQKC